MNEGMRITRELHVQGLLHSEQVVRNSFISMLGEQRYPGTDATRAAIAAVEKWGFQQAFEFPHQITSLALDEHCFDWMLEQLELLIGEEDWTFRIRATEWLARAPTALLESRWERFSQVAEKLSSDSEVEKRLVSIVREARRRLELDALSQEDRWEYLERTLEKCADADEFPHSEIGIAENCCEALTANGRADSNLQAKVMDWLALDPMSDVGQWQIGAAIRLAGLAGIRETVPDLLQFFERDWDWWNEEIGRALAVMGDLDVLRSVAEWYPEQPWYVRLYLSEVFQNVWIEGMDELIYPLLQKGKKEEGVNSTLGMALARYGSKVSMEAAARIGDEIFDYPDAIHIFEMLYSQYMVFDPDDPELDQWKEKIAEGEKRQADHAKNMEELLSIMDRFAELENQRNFLGDSFNQIVAPGKAPKIGRNDPCPCGSGKKYKKCCLG